jgi:hypothetical protein
MRKALVTLSILLVACVAVARAGSASPAAPADEYFGPAQQSVLEIRNRLNDYDRREDGAMLDPGVALSLNHLQLAILDWQHKYPSDPWLPSTLSHLMREYWRAGQASSEQSLTALAVMRSSYANSPETGAAVALIYGSNPALSELSGDAAQPVDQPATPVVSENPVPDVAAPPAAAPAVDLISATDLAPRSDAALPDAAPPSYAVAPSDQAPQAGTPDDAEPSYEAMPADAVPTPPPAR